MTVLADSSVWIDHWRRGNPRLAELLEGNSLVVHPFVLGEIALGQMRPVASQLAARPLPVNGPRSSSLQRERRVAA